MRVAEEEIISRLASGDVITQKDVEQICRHNGTTLTNLRPNVGKPFREILHGECGVFRLPFQQKHEPTPAPYQPALAGILATSQVILSHLRLHDAAKPVESSSDSDALILPRDGCIMVQLSNERCFCNDPSTEVHISRDGKYLSSINNSNKSKPLYNERPSFQFLN